LNILLDENLSPRLVARLSMVGVFAQHVSHVGLSGKSDFDVWCYAFAHEQIVITINAKDFLNLAANSELHSGLMILRQSGLTTQEQWEWIEPAIKLAKSEEEQGRNLINRAIEIFSPEHLVVRNLPDQPT
jgi:predicted nuclease of predicted toxin-antitoxin system